MEKIDKKVKAEDVLTKYVKGEIIRDYNKHDRKYYTVSIDVALRAMREFAKLKTKELISNSTH